MTLINGIIPSQGFELVRDRIGEILAEEMCGQFDLTGDEDLNVTVYIERSVRFDNTDMPCVNVYLQPSDYTSQYQGFSDGEYIFHIDVHTNGDSNEDGLGDAIAIVKCHKILGKCRAILENPVYKTLGFTSPFIHRRVITSIGMVKPESNDSYHHAMGKLIMMVKLTEDVALLETNLVGSYETSVKLSTTDKGYVFTKL